MAVALNRPHTVADRETLDPLVREFQKIAGRKVARVRRAFRTIVDDARAAIPTATILRAVEHGDPAAITRQAGSVRAHLAKAKKDAGDPIADVLAEIYYDAGAFGLRYLASFELTDVNAIWYAQNVSSALVSRLDDRVAAGIRSVLGRTLSGDYTPAQAANLIEQSLYLDQRGLNAVANYGQGLLDRVNNGYDLADAARAEGSSRALAPTKFLDAENVDTLVGRYADRWLSYEADTIARTETMRAANAGLVDGFRAAADAGLIDTATAQLQWFTAEDDRVCPECEALDGQTVDLVGSEVFDGGDSFGDVEFPPLHDDCRCTVILVDAGAPSVASLVSEAA